MCSGADQRRASDGLLLSQGRPNFPHQATPLASSPAECELSARQLKYLSTGFQPPYSFIPMSLNLTLLIIYNTSWRAFVGLQSWWGFQMCIEKGQNEG